MPLHYIYHSCFVYSDADLFIVYDYWRDPNGILPKFLEEAERDEKAVYFIVSHFHEDHFNPEIVRWCEERKEEQWYLLPSYDTVRRRHIDKTLPLAVLRFGETVQTPHFTLQAYRTTDVGVSTVVTLQPHSSMLVTATTGISLYPLMTKVCRAT